MTLTRARTLMVVLFTLAVAWPAHAHPLGNFTINHFARLEVGADRVGIQYVVDLAEIAAFQERQAADANGDGETSGAELTAHVDRLVAQYAEGVTLSIDGTRVPLQAVGRMFSFPPGEGGLPTLRIETYFTAAVPKGAPNAAHRLHFEDQNHSGRIGWREVVVRPLTGVTVFDSSAFGSAVTDELKRYPTDLLTTPLDEHSAEFSFTTGALPPGATPLGEREHRAAAQTSDSFAALITAPQLTPAVMLIAFLLAAGLGALHALSPGHGKTVVGAYLIGARGTARHAVFLGLTVTLTHTLGVFALGLLTLFASHYVVPERLFPWLTFGSGAIVLVMGLSLLVSRLRVAFSTWMHRQAHVHGLAHEHHDHDHDAHDHDHSHLPPGGDGSAITWRSLLALGVSGGIVPCPSALVVLLSAIALHRIAFGLLLIVAFSAGLAGTLTAVGFAFVYAGRLLKHPTGASGWLRVLPVVSALVIVAAGAAICYQAVGEVGISALRAFANSAVPVGWFTSSSVLGLGLVFGLKHALDADHLAAVSTIVSQRKSMLSSSFVGVVWGVGHTVSLLLAGVVMIVLHVKIGERMALALEFGVALMLIALGANVLRKLIRGDIVHLHAHQHGERVHLHPHLHDGSMESVPETHHSVRFSVRPLLVGMVHGLAGSAALMLLVLTTIPSPVLGLAYIAVFGVGSIGGMLFMSALVSLPFHLTASRFARAHTAAHALAGIFSVGLGLLMAYEIGVVGGLLL